MNNRDDIILKLLADNDYKALELLYDRFASLMYGIIFHIVQSEPKAEEILRQVFSDIWKKRKSFISGNQNLQGEIISIARKKALEHKSFSAFAHHQYSLNGQGLSADHQFAELSGDQKKVLELFFYEGGSLEHVSASLSKTTEETKKILRESIHHFKKETHHLA